MIKKCFTQAFMALTCGFFASGAAYAEFDEFEPIIEINATDGDIGFHVLLDGEAWRGASIFNNDIDRLMQARASNSLREQGATEFFMESAEPLCWDDPEAEPGEEIVTLEEFLERFEAGTYLAFGRDLDLGLLAAAGRFTHRLPAAPEVSVGEQDGTVTISWSPGSDLGNCAIPESLARHPTTIPVVRWEVVFETDMEDEMPEGIPEGKFVIQVPASAREVVVPEGFLQPYLDAGVTAFKAEIGAKEASGNQVFTEIEVDLGEEEEP